MTRNEALEELRHLVRPGNTVFTQLRHVSASGMTRAISFWLPYVKSDGTAGLTKLDWYMVQAGLGKFDRKHDGIRVSGCGMDMGFHMVYNLGYALWPNGTVEPHGTRNGEPDTDGGYALKHQWM